VDNAIHEAVQAVLAREKADRIVLPRQALEIPRDCLVNPRPIKIWGTTAEFLTLLDSKVRKAPKDGVSVEEACELMRRLGRPFSPDALHKLLRRTMPLHVLVAYQGRVRLSTAELMQKAS
jgi:hypothetical protein